MKHQAKAEGDGMEINMAGMNETPSSERTQIAFFGRRNAGKSSLLNAVTGQQMAIVSDIKGTTTDPVYKSMELLPAGPVMIIDTPGLDDEGELGLERIKKAKQVLRRTDLAVIVIDSKIGMKNEDEEILKEVIEKNIPYIIALNKTDKLISEMSSQVTSSATMPSPSASSGAMPSQVTSPGSMPSPSASSGTMPSPTAPFATKLDADTSFSAKLDTDTSFATKLDADTSFATKPDSTTSFATTIDSNSSSAAMSIASLMNKYPNAVPVSALTGDGINELKEKIAQLCKNDTHSKPIAADLVNAGDFVVLVVPIDKAAPKGRLILPQQQVIRDLLDHGIVPVVTRDTELAETLKKLDWKVSLVITDSQAFKKVDEIVPQNIPLTSFSILFARYKGELKLQLEGTAVLDELKDGDRILISEGCTHHRQCGDIGTEKIPALIRKYTGKDISIDFSSGTAYSDDIRKYKAVIHCGGCMLNEKEMKARIAIANENAVPISNYGMIIAKTTGILDRSIRVFNRNSSRQKKI